jgi:hypothetical protein
LVGVAGESRVRITIVEDVAAGINIARIILLAATKRKYPKLIYLKEFNLLTTSLTPRGKSHRRSKGRRSIIVDDAISIDIDAKRRWLSNPNLIL